MQRVESPDSGVVARFEQTDALYTPMMMTMGSGRTMKGTRFESHIHTVWQELDAAGPEYIMTYNPFMNFSCLARGKHVVEVSRNDNGAFFPSGDMSGQLIFPVRNPETKPSCVSSKFYCT